MLGSFPPVSINGDDVAHFFRSFKHCDFFIQELLTVPLDEGLAGRLSRICLGCNFYERRCVALRNEADGQVWLLEFTHHSGWELHPYDSWIAVHRGATSRSMGHNNLRGRRASGAKLANLLDRWVPPSYDVCLSSHVDLLDYLARKL